LLFHNVCLSHIHERHDRVSRPDCNPSPRHVLRIDFTQKFREMAGSACRKTPAALSPTKVPHQQAAYCCDLSLLSTLSMVFGCFSFVASPWPDLVDPDRMPREETRVRDARCYSPRIQVRMSSCRPHHASPRPRLCSEGLPCPPATPGAVRPCACAKSPARNHDPVCAMPRLPPLSPAFPAANAPGAVLHTERECAPGRCTDKLNRARHSGVGDNRILTNCLRPRSLFTRNFLVLMVHALSPISTNPLTSQASWLHTSSS